MRSDAVRRSDRCKVPTREIHVVGKGQTAASLVVCAYTPRTDHPRIVVRSNISGGARTTFVRKVLESYYRTSYGRGDSVEGNQRGRQSSGLHVFDNSRAPVLVGVKCAATVKAAARKDIYSYNRLIEVSFLD